MLFCDAVEYFLEEALPRVVRVLLSRVYVYEEREIPLVQAFLQQSLDVAILSLSDTDVLLYPGMLDTLYRIFDSARPFYVYDVPMPPPVRRDSDADAADMEEEFISPAAPVPPNLADNVNHFGCMGGFDTLMNRVDSWHRTWLADVDGQDVNLQELHSLLMPLMSVFPHLLIHVKKGIADKVRRCVHVRVRDPASPAAASSYAVVSCDCSNSSGELSRALFMLSLWIDCGASSPRLWRTL